MAFGISAATWIVGGAALGGAYLSSKSASKAADAQTESAAAANQTQREQYDQTRSDNAPWRTAGGAAIGQLVAGTQPGGQFTKSFGPTDFQGDPGYAFRLQQGQNALDNSAAARGGVLSGSQLKATTQYNQGMASQEYGNAYNRFNTDQNRQFNQLSSVAGTGQVANGTVATAGMNAANQIGNNQTGAGNAQASGYLAQGNALQNGLNRGVSAYNGYSSNMLTQQNNGFGALGYGDTGGRTSAAASSNALANGGWGIE